MEVLNKACQRALQQKKLLWLQIIPPWCPHSSRWLREVFEGTGVTRMKQDFEFLQIDRDEFPEIDGAAQTLLQVLANRQGWPVNLFLNARGEAIIGATSLDENSLMKLLRDLLVAYRVDPQLLDQTAHRSTQSFTNVDPMNERIGQRAIEDHHIETLLDTLMVPIAQGMDAATGVYGHETRSPFPHVYDYLLCSDMTESANVPLAEMALTKLGRSRYYDVIGGGFFRGGNKDGSEVFTEKLLGLNAELLEVYTDAVLKTKSGFLKQIAGEIFDCLMGDFYDSQSHSFRSWIASSDSYALGSSDLLESLAGSERQAAQIFFGISGQARVPALDTDVTALSGVLRRAPVDLNLELQEAKKKLKRHRQQKMFRASSDAPTKTNLCTEGQAVSAVLCYSEAFLPESEHEKVLQKMACVIARWQNSAGLTGARTRWSLGRALFVYARQSHSPQLLEWAHELLGDLENSLELNLHKISFAGRRWDFLDHVGISSEALRMKAWIESESMAPSAKRVECLRTQLGRVLGVSRYSGIFAASIFAAGRRVKYPKKDLVSQPSRPL